MPAWLGGWEDEPDEGAEWQLDKDDKDDRANIHKTHETEEEDNHLELSEVNGVAQGEEVDVEDDGVQEVCAVRQLRQGVPDVKGEKPEGGKGRKCLQQALLLILPISLCPYLLIGLM